jgi:hypothetical protein
MTWVALMVVPLVVSAEGQAGDPFAHVAGSGQEGHRDLRAAGPHAADHVEAIPVRHHDVQQDQVWPGCGRGPQRLRAVSRGDDLKPGKSRRSRQQLEDGGLVVHHEQARLPRRVQAR